MRMMCVLTLMSLTGCVGSNERAAIDLGDPPAGLIECTAAPLPDLPGAAGTPLDRTQVAQALAEQRAAALGFRRCAGDWLALYRDLAARLKAAGESQ